MDTENDMQLGPFPPISSMHKILSKIQATTFENQNCGN
jgi:hypothetical protein